MKVNRLALAVQVLVFLVAGAAIAQDVTPPVVSSVTVSPAIVAPGDIVHVIAEVTDDTGVTGVTVDSVPLVLTDADRWEGDISADRALGVHNVTVVASDAAGNTRADSRGAYTTASLLGIRCSDALSPLTLSFVSTHLFQVWGRCTYIDENSFWIDDGSDRRVKVISANHVVCNGDYVVAHGVLDPRAAPALIRDASYRVLAMGHRDQMSISNTTVGKDLMVSVAGHLPYPVQYGAKLKVMITSSDPQKVTLSQTADAVGANSIVLTVKGGSSSLPVFYVQGLADSGSVNVTAVAQGGLGKVFRVTLAPSGFVIYPGNFSTTSFSDNTSIEIRSARLDPATRVYNTSQSLRPGVGPISIPVISSDPLVGAITTSPVSISSGEYRAVTWFDPVNAGTATISIDTPGGFVTPSNRQSITATVTAADIYASDITVGRDLQASTTCYLQVSPPEPVDMTVTVDSPSVATITTDPAVEGSSSITLSGVANTSGKSFYVQGRSIGMTTLTVQAQGYNTVQKKITVDPSGFVIYSPASINTTSFSGNTAIQIRPAQLNPDTLAYSVSQSLRGGMADVTVPVSISGTEAGVLTASEVVLGANTISAQTEFDPVNAGTATISIGTPEGFDTPSNKQEIPVTVTAADIYASDITVGRDLQASATCYLQVSPPEPVDMTVTVDSPSVATITTDPAVEGSSSITLSGVANTSGKSFYVQGRSIGMTTLTVQAQGYNTVQKKITVDPSGFVIYSPASINTTSFSRNTAIQIRPARLNPDTLAYSSSQSLRGGMADVTVPVSISGTEAGVLTASEVVLGANTISAQTEFDPVNAGTATISIGTPEGFDTPSNKQEIPVTVIVPGITAYDVGVGLDLQTSTSVCLTVAPPAPVDITVEVGASSVATLTTDPSVEGSKSLTFPNVSSTGAKSFTVQGRSLGTTTLTISAPGYIPVQKTISVDPSGFVIYNPSSITTTAGASNTSVDIRPARLNPVNFTYSTSQRLRAGLSAEVGVVSSNTGVGVITVSPLTFGPNASTAKTYFDPLAAGTCILSVVQPDGFSSPTTRYETDVTVNP